MALSHNARPTRIGASDSELQRLLARRDWQLVASHLAAYPPAAIAAVLDDLVERDRLALFRALPRAEAYRAFPRLPASQRDTLLRDLGEDDAKALVAMLRPDDRTAVLASLPTRDAEELLRSLGPDELAVTRRLLAYPPDSAGRLMTPEVASIRPEWTVGEALAHLRRVGQDAETLDMVYAVDADGRLVDDLALGRLVLADPAAPVASIMDHSFVALRDTDDRRQAIRAMDQLGRVALPVVDEAARLVGIVTIDDVLRVAENRSTRQFQEFGGSEALDGPYMQIGLFRMVRKRAGWLSALFLGEMLTATAMGYFEDEIARAVVLALFVPLIISSGGNSGSQATSLVIRAIALGEVTLKDWLRVVLREAPTGIMLGSILGAIGAVRILAWQAVGLTDYGQFYIRVALTVTVSLVGVVLFGSLAGSLLPFVLRRIGFDPATASAPFVATLVDVSGLVIYFTIATLILRGTLL